jgi:hypothetical protein
MRRARAVRSMRRSIAARSGLPASAPWRRLRRLPLSLRRIFHRGNLVFDRPLAGELAGCDYWLGPNTYRRAPFSGDLEVQICYPIKRKRNNSEQRSRLAGMRIPRTVVKLIRSRSRRTEITQRDTFGRARIVIDCPMVKQIASFLRSAS